MNFFVNNDEKCSLLKNKSFELNSKLTEPEIDIKLVERGVNEGISTFSLRCKVDVRKILYLNNITRNSEFYALKYIKVPLNAGVPILTRSNSQNSINIIETNDFFKSVTFSNSTDDLSHKVNINEEKTHLDYIQHVDSKINKNYQNLLNSKNKNLKYISESGSFNNLRNKHFKAVKTQHTNEVSSDEYFSKPIKSIKPVTSITQTKILQFCKYMENISIKTKTYSIFVQKIFIQIISIVRILFMISCSIRNVIAYYSEEYKPSPINTIKIYKSILDKECSYEFRTLPLKNMEWDDTGCYLVLANDQNFFMYLLTDDYELKCYANFKFNSDMIDFIWIPSKNTRYHISETEQIEKKKISLPLVDAFEIAKHGLVAIFNDLNVLIPTIPNSDILLNTNTPYVTHFPPDELSVNKNLETEIKNCRAHESSILSSNLLFIHDACIIYHNCSFWLIIVNNFINQLELHKWDSFDGGINFINVFCTNLGQINVESLNFMIYDELYILILYSNIIHTTVSKNNCICSNDGFPISCLQDCMKYTNKTFNCLKLMKIKKSEANNSDKFRHFEKYFQVNQNKKDDGIYSLNMVQDVHLDFTKYLKCVNKCSAKSNSRISSLCLNKKIGAFGKGSFYLSLNYHNLSVIHVYTIPDLDMIYKLHNYTCLANSCQNLYMIGVISLSKELAENDGSILNSNVLVVQKMFQSKPFTPSDFHRLSICAALNFQDLSEIAKFIGSDENFFLENDLKCTLFVKLKIYANLSKNFGPSSIYGLLNNLHKSYITFISNMPHNMKHFIKLEEPIDNFQRIDRYLEQQITISASNQLIAEIKRQSEVYAQSKINDDIDLTWNIPIEKFKIITPYISRCLYSLLQTDIVIAARASSLIYTLSKKIAFLILLWLSDNEKYDIYKREHNINIEDIIKIFFEIQPKI
ncbi:hypothetical protein A3Q56_01011 [Intoshia linei]|uniref:Uncharacterized protein n=1 Tax=Intoshia linei TaxID=1819745 RepID=A0A177BAF3_9BILA|nr:hypothetical protein A3Q56_01011 [Intoshia linei]